ncbi:VOC family protein [Phenylobacterium sp. VNQ135]|uniref:VOC family protein n=1 Tax=Phenylobacterium sp. VNQ135 TaxID=3400922 RepID=UPI003C0041D1
MQWPSTRVTHVGLSVTDIDRYIDFGVNALGMKVMKRAAGRFATLSFGYQHHDIALLPVPPGTPKAHGAGLHHICFDLGNYQNWVLAFGRLVDAGVRVDRVTDHRTGVGIYFSDPEGNQFEFWYEAFSSMEEAIENGRLMSEEFEENYVGYPVDQAQLYRDYQAMKARCDEAPAASPARELEPA